MSEKKSVPAKGMMTIRIPEKLMQEMRELSFLTHTSMNQTITRLLEDNIPDLLKRAREGK